MPTLFQEKIVDDRYNKKQKPCISALWDIYTTTRRTYGPNQKYPLKVITDDNVKAALGAYPEIHLGWKGAFTRATEIKDGCRVS